MSLVYIASCSVIMPSLCMGAAQTEGSQHVCQQDLILCMLPFMPCTTNECFPTQVRTHTTPCIMSVSKAACNALLLVRAQMQLLLATVGTAAETALMTECPPQPGSRVATTTVQR